MTEVKSTPPFTSNISPLYPTAIPRTEDCLPVLPEVEQALSTLASSQSEAKGQTTPERVSSRRAFLLQVGLGLCAGAMLLVLITRVVDLPVTLVVLRQNLETWQGLLCASGAALAFTMAFSVRSLRWRLFLHRSENIPYLTILRIYWIGVMLNFLLPIQGGEVGKSLLLKRVTSIPVSRSLPTVGMDKACDLLPALVIIIMAPFLPGLHMSLPLWGILGLVSGLLLGLIGLVLFTAWKRQLARATLQKVCGIFPGPLRLKLEGFALGCLDTGLECMRYPGDLLRALLLTGIALTCDGIFAMLAFWTIGIPIPLGIALFGYTIYNMFCILPTPPGQLGSNEVIGVLVFSGLLHYDQAPVLAMFVFSHPLAALIMLLLGLLSLSQLGLSLTQVLRTRH